MFEIIKKKLRKTEIITKKDIELALRREYLEGLNDGIKQKEALKWN